MTASAWDVAGLTILYCAGGHVVWIDLSRYEICFESLFILATIGFAMLPGGMGVPALIAAAIITAGTFLYSRFYPGRIGLGDAFLMGTIVILITPHALQYVLLAIPSMIGSCAAIHRCRAWQRRRRNLPPRQFRINTGRLPAAPGLLLPALAVKTIAITT